MEQNLSGPLIMFVAIILMWGVALIRLNIKITNKSTFKFVYWSMIAIYLTGTTWALKHPLPQASIPSFIIGIMMVLYGAMYYIPNKKDHLLNKIYNVLVWVFISLGCVLIIWYALSVGSLENIKPEALLALVY